MAKVVNSESLKHTLSAKKINKVKTVLCTPYTTKEEKLTKSLELMVLQKLVTFLKQFSSSLNLLKSYTCFGVNETSRLLEKDGAKLILLDKSANLITSHLKQLSGTRSCKSLVLGDLETTIVKNSALTRASCIAFRTNSKPNSNDSKKIDSVVEEFISFCLDHATVVNVPWLNMDMQANVAVKKFEEMVGKAESASCDERKGEQEKVEDVKDFSHLYVYKPQKRSENSLKSKTHFSNSSGQFGDDFISFTSGDDEGFERHVTRSGRIKLFPKGNKTSETLSISSRKRKRKETNCVEALGSTQEKQTGSNIARNPKKIPSSEQDRFFISTSAEKPAMSDDTNTPKSPEVIGIERKKSKNTSGTEATTNATGIATFQLPNVGRLKPNEKRKKKKAV